MIRPIVLPALLLLAFPLQAQNWCPPGATWTYSYFDGWAGAGITRYVYAGDTLIDGSPCQRIDQFVELESGTIYDMPASVITKVDGDLISILTGTGFDTLYWFGAAPGDHWKFPGIGAGGEQVLNVTDTGTVVIDGLSLHYLATEHDTLIERIGPLLSLMTLWDLTVVDGPGGQLRCYSDHTISYRAPWWAYDCESLMDIADPLPGTLTLISPNPGVNQLVLQVPPGTQGIQIRDALGRMVYHTEVARSRIEVDTGAWPSGLYLVQVDALPAQRWVKE